MSIRELGNLVPSNMCVVLCIYIYIYILYMPRTCVRGLPFSFGKRSMAALKGAPSEHQGSKGEHERAAREQRGSIKGARESMQG